MSTPNTSKVKWVMPDRMIVSDEGFTVEEMREVGRVPVIPLADLADVVEGLMKERCYSNTVYNGALDDLMAQLEAHRNEG